MSQRGRGSGPHDEPEDADAGQDLDSDGFTLPPATRPIVPYDPYRSASGEGPRRVTRNVAAESFEDPLRGVPRRGGESPFLPNDDPLSAEAWQLEFEEADVFEDVEPTRPEPEREPPPRRPRRQPARGSRGAEAATGARRAPRRRSAEPAVSLERLPRVPVTIGVPRSLTGSSLAADQTALILLGINLASLVIMVLLLALRLGSLPSPTVLHLNAAGSPDRWGPPSVLWRLPVMSFFITVMFTIVAWFLHPIDRFAARFALGAAVVAQLVAWVAVLQHLFAA